MKTSPESPSGGCGVRVVPCWTIERRSTSPCAAGFAWADPESMSAARARRARRGTGPFCLFRRPAFKRGSVRPVSAFADVGSLGPQQIWDGVVGRSIHGDRATLSLLELDAGAVVPDHHHVNEQMGILVAGSLRFTIGGETRELGPGSTWRILAHVPHSVVVGPAGAVLVEVFVPGRDDWHELEQGEPRPGRWP